MGCFQGLLESLGVMLEFVHVNFSAFCAAIGAILHQKLQKRFLKKPLNCAMTGKCCLYISGIVPLRGLPSRNSALSMLATFSGVPNAKERFTLFM
jgi:hypothetical protein